MIAHHDAQSVERAITLSVGKKMVDVRNSVVRQVQSVKEKIWQA
jgi:hypothetical protein